MNVKINTNARIKSTLATLNWCFFTLIRPFRRQQISYFLGGFYQQTDLLEACWSLDRQRGISLGDHSKDFYKTPPNSPLHDQHRLDRKRPNAAAHLQRHICIFVFDRFDRTESSVSTAQEAVNRSHGCQSSASEHFFCWYAAPAPSKGHIYWILMLCRCEYSRSC